MTEADTDLVIRVYQRLFDTLPPGESWLDSLKGREEDERAFLALVMCGSEVDNGGFAQFFTNSTGEVAEVALRGAERLGLEHHAALLLDAMGLFPNGEVPLNHDDRVSAWDALDDEADGDDLDARLDALDQRWFALHEELESRLAHFARRAESGADPA